MVGFNARNRDSFDPKFICPICSLILRDPVQLSKCGHRICQSCFNNGSGTTTICPSCPRDTQRAKLLLDRGFKNEMQSLSVGCSLCNWNGTLNNYEEHLNHSHSNPKCEHCSRQLSSVDALNQHEISECGQKVVCRTLEACGYSEQIIRVNMEEQYLSQQNQDAARKTAHPMESEPIDSHTIASVPITAQSNQISETVNTILNGVRMSNNDVQCIKDELSQLQHQLRRLESDLLPLKLGVEENNNSLQGSALNRVNVNEYPTMTNENTDDTQYAHHDGTFVWKITKFEEKKDAAESGRQMAITSRPFYSSQSGYKMGARLYLYGDGNARGTHLSLFFVLMRSEYDAILTFPFHYQVTFCIYDQSGAGRHIIDSFRPDIRSNSFQRPRSDMNIASGIPTFCSLSMIQQEGNPYVRDDTMFIKIMVNFSDMRQSLLSYASSLNPGLPTNIQHNMVIQEAKRRTEQKH